VRDLPDGLKRRIVVAGTVVLIVALLLVVSALLVPSRVLRGLVGAQGSDTTQLGRRAEELARALKSGATDRIYRLFNSSFRAEFSARELDSVFQVWRRGRTVNRIVTSHREILGPSGMVSTHVFFKDAANDTAQSLIPGTRLPRTADFVFQTWLRTSRGWELLWLSKILDPIEMDYGRTDTVSLREILQLGLTQIITKGGMESLTGVMEGPRRVVLQSRGVSDRQLTLPGREVIWLEKDSIEAYRRRLGVDYYIDIQPLRILKEIAIGTFDIVPLTQDGPTRRRSIRMLFVQKGGRWRFADYGTVW
jgi:hypothetical protein